MAASGIPVLASTLLLLCGRSFAATLHSEGNIVRRERASTAQLSTHGEFVSQRLSPADQVSAKSRTTPLSFQLKDFVLGVEKTNTCKQPAKETMIGSHKAECEYAANRTGAHKESMSSLFELTSLSDRQLHPEGCFYKKCVPAGAAAGSAEVDCFFYNTGDASISDSSLAGFSGIPVCHRSKYVDGAENAQGCLDDDYKVIDDRDECLIQCDLQTLTGCDNDDFEIADAKNYTRHHDFPKGCFHLTAETEGAMNTVFFNNYHDDTEVAGKAVEGTTICKVKAPLKLSGAPPAANANANAGAGGKTGAGAGGKTGADSPK
jgi:hypothetical protein